jgi:hypothetical protein
MHATPKKQFELELGFLKLHQATFSAKSNLETHATKKNPPTSSLGLKWDSSLSLGFSSSIELFLALKVVRKCLHPKNKLKNYSLSLGLKWDQSLNLGFFMLH